jgi:uncharacterized membrane protein YraQ (UPF0718 family)
MSTNTLVLLCAFLALVIFTLVLRGQETLLCALRYGGATFLKVIPLMVLGIAIAGLLRVLVPERWVSTAAGPGSGIRGYLFGWALGAVLPGPYTFLPLAVAMLDAGAGIGPAMTLVLSGSIVGGLAKVPIEIAYLGWQFPVLRFLSCLFLPLLGGWSASWVGRLLGLMVRETK